MYTQYVEEDGLDKILYPVNSLDIPHLKMSLNISINLFSYFDDIGKARHPMYISLKKVLAKLICYTLTSTTHGSKILAVSLKI